MISFFKKLSIVLVCLFAFDRLLGWGLEQLFYQQKHGDDFVTINLLQNQPPDVLVLGGSRASHHFNATQIEDSTGLTCFNGGRDDMTILYANAVLPVVFGKKPPKVLIIDMTPIELWEDKAVHQRVSTVLLPFMHRYPDMRKTVALAGRTELFKSAVSHIYPFNSTIGSSVQNAYTSLGHVSVKGYEPLDNSIDTGTYKTSIWANASGNRNLDTNSVTALDRVIALTKRYHTRLIVTISPFYFENSYRQSNSYNTMREKILGNGGELYDFSHDLRFLKNPALFSDDIHLNDSGAGIFTQDIIHIIQNPKGTRQ